MPVGRPFRIFVYDTRLLCSTAGRSAGGIESKLSEKPLVPDPCSDIKAKWGPL